MASGSTSRESHEVTARAQGPSSRDSRLTAAYDEYCQRIDAGQTVNVSSFCQQYPSIARSLFRQLEVDRFWRAQDQSLLPKVEVTWPQRGDAVFGFVVDEEIGRGAFARAYVCSEPDVGNRQVVLKVSATEPTEADLMGTLTHPNIMAVLSVQYDADARVSGICMPFVGRSNLLDVLEHAFADSKQPRTAAVVLEASRARVRRRDRYMDVVPTVPLRPTMPYSTAVLVIAQQLARALQHAHQRGIVHGDLKPSNVVMSNNGVPMIVDFNLAQRRSETSERFGGTVPYMAPERIDALWGRGVAPLEHDPRTDIYSWGVLLYEMLTGALPFVDLFSADDDAECHWERKPITVDDVYKAAPHLDAALAQLIVRCLALDPDDRPQQMDEVIGMLGRALSPSRRAVRAMRQRRKLVGSVTASSLVVASLALGAWLNLPARRDRELHQGLLAYRRSAWHEAKLHFSQAIAEDRDFPEAFAARACAALQQYQLDLSADHLKAAYDDFNLALRLNQTNHDWRAARAYCLLKMGNLELAEREYEWLLERGVRTCEVLNNLAFCSLRPRLDHLRFRLPIDESVSFARDLFLEASKKCPESPIPVFNVVKLDVNTRDRDPKSFDVDAALERIRRVIHLDPDNSSAFFLACRIAALKYGEDRSEVSLDECVRYANRAVDLGHQFNVKFIREGHPLFEVIQNRRFYTAISRQPITAVRSQPSQTLLPALMHEPCCQER